MEYRIIAFWVAVYVVIWLLSLYPRSTVSRIAFSWFGPAPREGESWAKYQLRWAFYSLDWLGQIAFLFALLFGAAYLYPGIEKRDLFLAVAALGLPIGAGMAVLAMLAFLIKAAKARYIGPNPVYGAQQ